MRKQSGKATLRVLSAFLTISLFAIFLLWRFPPYFSGNDDPNIRSIISGRYTGSPHYATVYQWFTYSGVIALFYRMIRGVDWYSVIFEGLHFLCLFLILIRLLRWNSKISNQLLICILFGLTAFILDGKNVILLQYTILAGTLMATAVFLFLTETKGCKLISGGNIVAVLLASVALAIRQDAFLMCFPFLAIAVCYRFACEYDKKNMKQQMKQYGFLFLLLVFLTGFGFVQNKVAYSGPDWNEFAAYNEDRTAIYDYYGIPGYDGNREFYDGIGVDRSGYELILSYNISFDDSIDANTIHAVAVKAKQLWDANRVGYNAYGSMFMEYFDLMLGGKPAPLGFAVLLLYIVACVYAYVRRRLPLTVALIASFGMRSILLCYLIYQGRYPERVIVPLYFMEVLLILGMLLYELKLFRNSMYPEKTISNETTKPERSSFLVPILTMVSVFGILAILGLYEYKMFEKQHEADVRLNTPYAIMMDYMKVEHPDSYFLMDVHAIACYAEKAMDARNSMDNYIYLGGWMADSPLQKKKISHDLHMTPAEALLDKDNVYIVQEYNKDVAWLTEYYRERYDRNVTVTVADEVSFEGTGYFKIYSIN